MAPVRAEGADSYEYLPPVQVGLIRDSRLPELSGMVPATGLDGFFWAHNDSADTSRFFCIRQDGTVIAEYDVPSVPNVDWEDMAAGPGPEPGVSYLFFADMGNNARSRTELAVYRLPEPALPSLEPGQLLVSEVPAAMRLRFPDGLLDCEAFAVHPLSGDFYFISKEQGTAGVYHLPQPPADGTLRALERIGSVTPGGLVTAADVSRDGGRLLVRTYSQVRLHVLPEGAPFAAIFFEPPQILPAASERQSESICFDHRDRDVLTSSEGLPAPIHRIRLKVPQPWCAPAPEALEPHVFLRGDVLEEAVGPPLSVTDGVALADAVAGALSLRCWDRADADDSGAVDGRDVSVLLDALLENRRLPAPSSEPGLDPSADDLLCGAARWEELVAPAAAWRYWSAPSPPAAGWQEPGADDGSWDLGAGGIGFGAEGLGTVLEGARGSLVTIYARADFTVEEPDVDALLLQIDTNDGFVAYLNGIEVARRGLGTPGFEVPPDLTATFHPGGAAEDVYLCAEPLAAGRNVLALEVHNRALEDATLFFRARLRGVEAAPPPEPPGPEPLGPPRAVLSLDMPSPPNLGDAGEVRILCRSDVPFRAFSFALSYDPGVFTLRAVREGEAFSARPSAAFFQERADTRRGVLAALGVASIVPGGEEAFAAGGPVEIARVEYTVSGLGGGTTALELTEREGLRPLGALLAAGGPGAAVHSVLPAAEGLEVEVTHLGLPVVEATVNARGEPGTVFLVLGRRFGLPGLAVRVCGREAPFELVDTATLQVVAPGCDAEGWAEVEVCNENGCGRRREGFLYTGLGPVWIRGDADGSGTLEITDAIAMLGQLFRGIEASPACDQAFDANADGRFDLSDAVFLLRSLFQGSVELEPPVDEPARCWP